MKDFKKLKVWEKAHQNTLNIYRKTENFPKKEVYGLTSQGGLLFLFPQILQRVAENFQIKILPDICKYLLVQPMKQNIIFLLAKDLGYFTDSDYSNLNSSMNEIKAMLISLLKRVRN